MDQGCTVTKFVPIILPKNPKYITTFLTELPKSVKIIGIFVFKKGPYWVSVFLGGEEEEEGRRRKKKLFSA